MTSTDILRLITSILSGLTILYIVIKEIKNKRIRNILILPFTVLINIFLRYTSILFFKPLIGVEVVFYNNWNSIIIIQTIMAIFGMTLYLSRKEKS